MAEVSIIVTTYNVESYVEECLASVAAQTLQDIEVLVVDDGSTDATPERIEAFCAADPRFVPVLLGVNSPGGVATAANAGLDLASAPWVGFVDGDDVVEPTMFARLLDAAVTYNADLAMCQYQEFEDGTGQRKDPADAHRWGDLTAPVHRLDVHSRKKFLAFIAVPWRKLYRRSLLEDNEIRFPVGDHFFEDNPFHWFSVITAGSIALVPEVLCHHRLGRAGQTMATLDSRLFQIFRHHDTIHAWLVGRRLLDVYAPTLLAWVVSQIEWISRRTPPPLRRELFDILVPIFAQYTETTLRTALREGHKGANAQRLALAVHKREYGSFARALATRPTSSNPVVSAAYHVRHSGPRHTAQLTARYLRNRLAGRSQVRIAPRARGVGSDPTSTSDVMFGLMVLQRSLVDLGERLAAVEARLEGLQPVGGADGSPSTGSGHVDEEWRNGVPALDGGEDAGRRA